MTEVTDFNDLIVQGARYKTTLTPKFKNRKVWKAPNSNLIYSFIPGTVVDILAKPGQKLKQGETILVLEAMKMLNNVLMPFDGEVVRVNVRVNDVVSTKHAMVELRPR